MFEIIINIFLKMLKKVSKKNVDFKQKGGIYLKYFLKIIIIMFLDIKEC